MTEFIATKAAATMVKHVKAAKSVPALPPRPGLSEAGEPGFRGWGVFAFPPQNKLIITTTKGVYAWDVYGVTEIFRSGSEGIVAAKTITSDNGMIAVADSQVVVLHEVTEGMQRSYRLKGSQVRATRSLLGILPLLNKVLGSSQASKVCQRVG